MEDIGIPLNTPENRKYLEDHHMQIYLEDAIMQMFSLRHESNKMKPAKFFREYFCSVHQGSHVLFREFAFINATPYNRLCVLKAIMQIYKPLLYRVEKLSAKDYHSLLQLLWPDFPYSIIHETFLLINSSENMSEFQIPFLEFITAFRKMFCTGNLTYEAKLVYEQMLIREEEYSKIDVESQNISELNDKHISYVSEGDLMGSIQENEGQQQAASSWSLPNSLIQNSELKKILCLKESNSFSNDEPIEIVGKLPRSLSGSKDTATVDQATSHIIRPPTANIRGRLCPRHLSSSLNLLQPDDPDKQDSDAQVPARRLRSKSAVNIQRSSTLPHKT